MNFISLTSIIFLFSNFIFAQVSDSERIYWQEEIQLNWSDFEADAKHESRAAALSSLSIPYTIKVDDKKVYLQIRVCFIKTESWSKVDFQSDNLLLHEQLHFDIAELHRRMIVKKIREMRWSKEKVDVDLSSLISDHWVGDYRKMQDLYDLETDFSKNEKKQRQWTIKINKLLKKYESYSSEEILILI